MTSRDAVKCMSGMIAKGMPNDRATCETTSAHARTLRATGFLIAAVIVALNLFLVYLTFTGQG